MHLLLPLLSSLLFVVALILVKRANHRGVGPVTILFLTTELSAILFTSLWFVAEAGPPQSTYWQPATIAVLFLLGLTLTFLAVHRGDVSVATPVLGLKVLLVAVFLTLLTGTEVPTPVWYAAALATFGIGMIQWTGRRQGGGIVTSIVLALGAATTYATFDVLVQRWSPAWGPGRFLPMVYVIVAPLALVMTPWVQWKSLRDRKTRAFVWGGSFAMALQSFSLVYTLSAFGDAARVNVVYALRGLWAVILAWGVAKVWGGEEADLTRGVMSVRFLGALLLTVSVILAIQSMN